MQAPNCIIARSPAPGHHRTLFQMKSDSQRPPRLVTSPDIPLLTGSTSAAQQMGHEGQSCTEALAAAAAAAAKR